MLSIILANGIKEKSYLRKANSLFPEGWRLVETFRIAKSGHPTFSLQLALERAGVMHIWPVMVNMPRRVLREFVLAIEKQGFGSLFDPNLLPSSSYTAMVGVVGYEPETLGLLEAIIQDNLYFVLMNCFSAPKRADQEIVIGGESEIDRLLAQF